MTTLRELVKETIIKAGENGKEELAEKSGLSVETVRRVLYGYRPLPKNIYRLAKACGCTDSEAMILAKESASEKAMKAVG